MMTISIHMTLLMLTFDKVNSLIKAEILPYNKKNLSPITNLCIKLLHLPSRFVASHFSD